jgi:hypothetical protein
VLLAVGALVGIGVAAAVGASMASASPHSTAVSSPSAGVTLCAKRSGVLIYEKKSKCPRGDTRLAVDRQSQATKLASEVTSLEAQVAALTKTETAEATDVSSLQRQVGSLNILTTGMSRTKDPDSPAGQDWPLLTISGENVEVNNGDAESSMNGLGNLIVGYDTGNDYSHDRSGSNNLVVGVDSGWSSFGGLLAGFDNDLTATADLASVTGGDGNIVSGGGASVTGGYNNTASGGLASVAGGFNNTADEKYAAILGGYGQTSAPDDCSTIPTGAAVSGCP